VPVELDSGPAGGSGITEPPRDAGQQTLGYLYETYVAYLYDYCENLLQSPGAAAVAVPEALIAAAASIGRVPDPGGIRVWLYSIARGQCLSGLPDHSEMAVPHQVAEERPVTADVRTATAGADTTIAGTSTGTAGAGTPDAGPAGAGTPDAGPADTGPADTGPADTGPADTAAPDADTGEIYAPDVGAAVLGWETLQIGKSALDWLPDREREVLNLVYRHGFDCADLAALLGVSLGEAHALWSDACAKFQMSAAAIVIRRADDGGAACPILKSITGERDAAAPPLTLRRGERLIRHIESCDHCGELRRTWVLSPELLSGVQLTVPPVALRQQVHATVFAADPGAYRRKAVRRFGRSDAGGFPVRPKAGRSPQLAVAAALILSVLIGAGALVHKLTEASGADPGKAAANVVTGNRAGTTDPPRASPGRARAGRARAARARAGEVRRNILAPPPGVRGLSPAPAGLLPAPSSYRILPSPTPPPSGSTAPSPTSSRQSRPPSPSSSSPASSSPSPSPSSPSPSSPSSPAPSPSPSSSGTSASPTPSST
jgi:RNA polymerase sigma factor (sigma-70 family)